MVIKCQDIINLSNLFIKKAQHTEFDKTVTEQKNYKENYFGKYHSRRPQQFTFETPDEEGNVKPWVEPIDFQSTIKPINLSEDLNLPEIEKFHIKLPEEYQDEFLETYNLLREEVNNFKSVYNDANETLAKGDPDLGLEHLHLIEAVRKFPDLFYLKAIYFQNRKFGKQGNRNKYLADFINGAFNVFNSKKYEYEREPSVIREMNSIIGWIQNALQQYDSIPERAEKFRKKLQQSVDLFLSDKKNLKDLNTLNKFPEAKEALTKKVVDDYTAYYDRNFFDIRDSELDNLYLDKYLKKLTRMLSDRFTHDTINHVSSKVFSNLRQYVDSLIKEIDDKYTNILHMYVDEAKFITDKRLLSEEELSNVLNNLLEDAKTPSNLPTRDQLIIKFYEKFKKELLKCNIDFESYISFKKINNEGFIRTYISGLSSFPDFILNNFESEREARGMFYKLIEGRKIENLIENRQKITSPEFKSKIEEMYQKELVKKLFLRFPDAAAENVLLSEGSYSFKSIANLIKKILPIDGNELLSLVKYCIKNDEILINITGNELSSNIIYRVLNKNNKKDFNNLIKYFSDRNLLEDIYHNFRSVNYYNTNGNKRIISEKDLELLSSDIIRTPETQNIDLANLKHVFLVAHNSASNLTLDQLRNICKNQNFGILSKIDAIKKIYSVYMGIQSEGGIKFINKQYKSGIKTLKERKLISYNFINNLKKLCDLFDSNKKINPEVAGFDQMIAFCNKVDSDLTMVKTAEAYKELYEKSEEKIPELFLIDFSINPKLRFRVLRDKDPRHLKIGVETNCCQRVGENAIGETAARDSFINKEAGVVILEWYNDREWLILAQSYFHYVPKDNGYILDNVEMNERNVSLSGVNLEEVYAYYAREMTHKLDLKYFIAGRGYSKINPTKFGNLKMKRDPRRFNPGSLTPSKREHYIDFKVPNSINLNQPKFKIKSDPKTWGQDKTGKK